MKQETKDRLVMIFSIGGVLLIVVAMSAIAYRAGMEHPFPRPTVTVTK